MNKGDLVDHIADDLEISKAMADKLINSFTEAIYANVRRDGVRLAGFGSFGAVRRKARMGRNPQTGEEIKIPSRWVPTFKSGTVLKSCAEKRR